MQALGRVDLLLDFFQGPIEYGDSLIAEIFLHINRQCLGSSYI